LIRAVSVLVSVIGTVSEELSDEGLDDLPVVNLIRVDELIDEIVQDLRCMQTRGQELIRRAAGPAAAW